MAKVLNDTCVSVNCLWSLRKPNHNKNYEIAVV